MLNYMLIRHKNIFECFSCFWKVFLFWKMSKISKIVQPCLATCLVGQASRMPQSRAFTKGFHDSLAGQSPSCEKDLEIFPKSRFLDFSRLYLATCSWVEALVVRCTQNVSQLPTWLPHGWTFQSWKTLRQNFSNFCLKGFGNLVWRLVRDSF